MSTAQWIVTAILLTPMIIVAWVTALGFLLFVFGDLLAGLWQKFRRRP